jgi:hypothetical protein
MLREIMSYSLSRKVEEVSNWCQTESKKNAFYSS